MTKPETGAMRARRGVWQRASERFRRSRTHREVEYLPPLSPAEASTLLDHRTRQYLKLSADDFVCQYRAGKLPDTSVVHGLAMLAGEVPSSRAGSG